MSSRSVGSARPERVVVALLLTAAAALPALADDDPLAALSPEERAAYESLVSQRILSTIRFLASNRLEGREAGERGLEIAADYLVSRFQAAGLEPGAKRGFEQSFDLRWRVLDPAVELVLERGLRSLPRVGASASSVAAALVANRTLARRARRLRTG